MKHLLCTRHFWPSQNTYVAGIISHTFRWCNRGIEAFCHTLKVTQLVDVAAGLNWFNPNVSLVKGKVDKTNKQTKKPSPTFVVMIMSDWGYKAPSWESGPKRHSFPSGCDYYWMHPNLATKSFLTSQTFNKTSQHTALPRAQGSLASGLQLRPSGFHTS